MRKQLKNLCIFVVVLAFVLVGCTEKMLQEPTINQTEQAIAEQEQSLPLSSWRHGYLDKALTYEYTQFADASKRTVPALSTMSIASKLDLLESLQQEKGKRNTADDAFYEDLVQQMEADLEGEIELSTNPEMSNSIIATGNIIDLGGMVISKMEILEIVERTLIEQEGKRGFSVSNNKLWDKEIRYRFEKDTKQGIINNTKLYTEVWSRAANNKIRFTEIPNNAWNRFTWNLGLDHHLKVSEINPALNVAGQATVGKVGWATLEVPENSDIANLRRIYLHEIGHVLGLEHEHQRYDRDERIRINWNNIEDGYDIWFNTIRKDVRIPLYVIVRIGFIRIPVQVGIHIIPISNTHSEFDYNSIMMYGPTAFGRIRENGVRMVTIERIDGQNLNRNTRLSTQDSVTIQNLYK